LHNIAIFPSVSDSGRADDVHLVDEHAVQVEHDRLRVKDAHLRGVIFDLDGVLAISEPLLAEAAIALFAEKGHPMTADDFKPFIGMGEDRYLGGAAEHRGIELDLERDKARLYEIYEEVIRGRLKPLPGAVEFVGKLAAQYPLAIASGSFRVEIEHLLGKIGLREAFQVLVTADDVEHSKPEPDAFLKALNRLRQLPELGADAGQAALDPANCLVIEDAPAGVRAAHAAGMKCLALAHTRPLVELRHADWARRDFGEVDLEEIARAFQNSGE